MIDELIDLTTLDGQSRLSQIATRKRSFCAAAIQSSQSLYSITSSARSKIV
jgi:hypothetical protein